MQQAKIALRKKMRDILKDVPLKQQEDQTKVVVQKLFAMEQYQKAQRISIYCSMPGEIQTDDIIKDIFNKGKQCFVPSWNRDEMDMVRLGSFEEFQNLPLNKWGIKEPLKNDTDIVAMASKETALDLIIMPGLCFDKEGWRLGHGKGYYDRFLAKALNYASSHGVARPFTVCLALNEQIISDNVPRDKHDMKPDMILSV